MEFLEKDLEQIIWESNEEQLDEAGLFFSGKRFRQLRIGNYGIADLVTLRRSKDYDFELRQESNLHNCISIDVYELKKDQIGIAAFLQAVGYVKGIQRYIEERGIFEKCRIEYRIKLIGRTIDTSGSFAYLCDMFDNDIDDFTQNFYIQRPLTLSYYTYHYSIDGLKFKNHSGYKLSKEGF